MRIQFKDLGPDWPLENPIDIEIDDASTYQVELNIKGPTYLVPFYGRARTMKEAIANLKKDIRLFMSINDDSLVIERLKEMGFVRK